MAVYLIVEVKEIFNKEKYAQYIQDVPLTIEKFGGRYLSRGAEVKVISGLWHPARLIIVEFDSMDQFNAWWNSPEYKILAPLREQGAKTDAIVVEGV